MASLKKLLQGAPRMRNSMSRKAERGDTVSSIKGSISPVPNGPLVKRKGIVRGVSVKGSTLKKGGSIVKVGGQTHKVFKNKKGDIVVDHTAGIPAGKWDKINLTKKARAKTVKQGVASVRKWHKDNPNYKYKGKKK